MENKKSNWWAYTEIKFNNFNMMSRSLFLLIGLGFLVQIVVAVYIVNKNYIDVDFHSFKIVLNNIFGNFYWITFGDGATKENAEIIIDTFSKFGEDLLRLFLVTSPVQIIVLGVFIEFFRKKADDMTAQKRLSGAELLSEKAAIKKSKKFTSNFEIGSIKFPEVDETAHVLVIGSSGSGKTQLLKKVINKAVAENKKAIVHDIKGDWIAEFYDSNKDLIFNPLDARSLKWTFFNDIDDIADIKNFVNWIIPEIPGIKDPFWTNSSRAILEACLIWMWKNDKTANKDLKELVMLDGDKLAQTLSDIQGGDFVRKKDSYLTFKSYMNWIVFLEDGDFSIKKWVDDGEGFIYLSNTEKTEALFRPIMTLFVNVLGSHILSLNDDLERRLFLFLDEFTALSRLEQVLKLLKLGRSKGASMWLAFQDFQQLEKIYSREDMRTVINNCGSIAVLQLKEPQAAQYFSERFGKMEFIEKSQTTSMGVAVNRDGLSFNEQRKSDYIVKSADILNLEPLRAFVMIRSIGITFVAIPLFKSTIKNQIFVKRDGFSKEEQLKLIAPLLIIGANVAESLENSEEREVNEDDFLFESQKKEEEYLSF